MVCGTFSIIMAIEIFEISWLSTSMLISLSFLILSLSAVFLNGGIV